MISIVLRFNHREILYIATPQNALSSLFPPYTLVIMPVKMGLIQCKDTLIL